MSRYDIACEPRDPPSTLGAILRRTGPGIIVAGSIVGSGELIATTKVGAQAGFAFLWLILGGCVIKVFTQIELGRASVAAGSTPLETLDALPGPRLGVGWALWAFVAMFVLTIGLLGGIVGGIGQALANVRPLTEHGAQHDALHDELVAARVELAGLERGIVVAREGERDSAPRLRAHIAELEERAEELGSCDDPVLWAAIVALVTAVVLAFGRYGLVQLVATVLVAGFTIVTLGTVIVLQTREGWALDPRELARGLVPQLPEGAPGVSPIATALAAFGIIGVGASELVMYPYWCLEKGYARWTGERDGSDSWVRRARGWMRVLRVDAWLSMLVYTTATLAFYVLGATVLRRVGLDPEGESLVRTLAVMYVPVFGPWAQPVFLIGAFAILYSTFFVGYASMGRVGSDAIAIFFERARSPRARIVWTRVLCALGPLTSLVIFVVLRSPVELVLWGGVAQALMLPVLSAAALWLRYRRIPPELAPGRAWDAMLWLSCAAFLVAGVWIALTKLGLAG